MHSLLSKNCKENNEFYFFFFPPSHSSTMQQDTVGTPAGLCNWVAYAMWVKLLQWRHGNRIPDLHSVTSWNQADCVHDNVWGDTYTQIIRIDINNISMFAISCDQESVQPAIKGKIHLKTFCFFLLLRSVLLFVFTSVLFINKLDTRVRSCDSGLFGDTWSHLHFITFITFANMIPTLIYPTNDVFCEVEIFPCHGLKQDMQFWSSLTLGYILIIGWQWKPIFIVQRTDKNMMCHQEVIALKCHWLQVCFVCWDRTVYNNVNIKMWLTRIPFKRKSCYKQLFLNFIQCIYRAHVFISEQASSTFPAK